MTPRPVTLTPLAGIPLVQPGDDLADLLIAAIGASRLALADADVLVVTQKIVSKAEGRIVDLGTLTPSPEAIRLAAATGKDPRYLEAVLSELVAVVRSREELVITEHRNGWIMANAGIDRSNLDRPDDGERVLLLPRDPDASAAALKQRIDAAFGVETGIVISNSFGRPWRNGVIGTAIGTAGIPSLRDLRGEPDLFGRPLEVTEVAVADAIAAAAALVMGEAADGCPAVHVRGLSLAGAHVGAAALIRPKERDLFR